MSRRLALVALPLLAVGLIAARKPGDPKYEHRFTSAGAPQSSVMGLTLTNAESQQEFAAVDAKATNTTKDQYLVYKRGEASFVTATGVYGTKAGGLFGGPLFILPGATKSVAFKAEGGADFHVDQMTLQPKGFYSAPQEGKPLGAPDFTLPASVNDFKAGPYACKLTAVDQKTDHTAASFACLYSGEGLGIVEPSRVGVRAPNGQEFANAAKKAPKDILLPGDTSKFTLWFEIPAKVVDMQFATLQIVWRDALTESPLTSVPLADWAFTLDAELTKSANN